MSDGIPAWIQLSFEQSRELCLVQASRLCSRLLEEYNSHSQLREMLDPLEHIGVCT